MPTIAEIIAAKKAAAAAPATTERKTVDGIDYARNPLNPEWVAQGPAKAGPKESLAEKLAAKEAIDRIDPPGKQERATAARKSAGLILSQDMPATAGTQDQRMEVPRELSQPSNDQQMCVVIEGTTVWLCMPCEDPATPPIKVLRLPLTVWPYPAPEPLPEGDPF